MENLINPLFGDNNYTFKQTGIAMRQAINYFIDDRYCRQIKSCMRKGKSNVFWLHKIDNSEDNRYPLEFNNIPLNDMIERMSWNSLEKELKAKINKNIKLIIYRNSPDGKFSGLSVTWKKD